MEMDSGLLLLKTNKKQINNKKKSTINVKKRYKKKRYIYKQSVMDNKSTTTTTTGQGAGTGVQLSKSGKKICCVCKDTKKLRDECVVMKGEENCAELIAKHRVCLRDEGFDI